MLFAAAGQALALTDVDAKLALTQRLLADWKMGKLTLAVDDALPTIPVSQPGRPARPPLVHPRKLARRSLQTSPGRVALIHAVTHIEFNAINLALDAVHRFRTMPPDYYTDWLRVAADEARHFSLLRERLRQLGVGYGDLPAHDGLWDMACRTADDVLSRMALVPRVLEARGLDVTPGMIEKLTQAGDRETAAILAVILDEEIGHVAVGSRWFNYLCEQRGLLPQPTFAGLVEQHFNGQLRGPFNVTARLGAGFSAAELAALKPKD